MQQMDDVKLISKTMSLESIKETNLAYDKIINDLRKALNRIENLTLSKKKILHEEYKTILYKEYQNSKKASDVYNKVELKKDTMANNFIKHDNSDLVKIVDNNKTINIDKKNSKLEVYEFDNVLNSIMDTFEEKNYQLIDIINMKKVIEKSPECKKKEVIKMALQYIIDGVEGRD